MPSATLHRHISVVRYIHTLLVVCVVFLTVCIAGVMAFLVSFGLVSRSHYEMIPLFSAHSLGIAGVGLAVSTQVGSSGVFTTPSTPSGLSSVGLIGEIGKVANSEATFLGEHFERIDGYANLLTTDISILLDRSDDRAQTLDSYIDELSYRRDDAVSQLVDLSFQRSVFSSELTSIQDRITTLQQSIASGYEGRDEFAILESLDGIENLRTQEADVRSQLIFLDRFGSDYQSLIAATDTYLPVLRANREALASGISVQIVGGDTATLERLNLVSYPTNP